jgi:aminopeptidase
MRPLASRQDHDEPASPRRSLGYTGHVILETPDLLSAKAHVHDILTFAVGHTSDRRAVVVSDTQSELARIVSDAYCLCLPAAVHVNFDAVPPAAVMRSFESLTAGDLVVLVQSTSFRLEAFRIRVELFKRGLKVIEHPHLARMMPGEYGHYIDSLAYDPGYYRVVGPALKERIDLATSAVVDSGGEPLVYASGFEPAKLNVGDYSAMKNVGGQFPIGEVFTEPRDLESVNGRVRIFVFGDTDFRVNVPERPITLVVQRGKVIDVVDSTHEFDRVIAQIQADEALWIRELGFGMNRALTRDRLVSDIGTYERMCGIHLSLGAKHGVYNKPALKRKDARYHVDVFAITDQVLLDGVVVYRDGAWRV